MIRILFCFVLLLGWASAWQVTALHPLMADLARQVGGKYVLVHDAIGEGNDPHHYTPKPNDIQRMQQSDVILFAGMGLESYVDKLRDNLPNKIFLDVGATIPSLKKDPHWWHSIANMKRAARVVATQFSQLDVENKDAYFEQAAAYSKKLDTITAWAKSELSVIPVSERKLVVSHDAFAYFAKEFDFQVIAVAGLNHEQNTTPRDLANIVSEIKQTKTKILFPELGASDHHIKMIAESTACRLAEPLIADGNGRGKNAGFEGMIRHNILVIIDAWQKKE